MNKFNPLINRKLSKEEQKEKIKVKCDFCTKEKTISKLAYRKNLEKNNKKYRCKSCAQKGKIISEEQKEKIRATLKGYSYKQTKKIKPIPVLYNFKKILKDLDEVIINCFSCEDDKIISYRDATINVNRNNGKFFCRICTLKSKNPVFDDKIKEKIKNTNIKRYGNACSMNTPEIKKKAIESWLLNKDKILEKTRKKCLEKYGVEHFSQSHIPKEVVNKLNNPQWLKHQHEDLKKNGSIIAQELQTNPWYVNRKLNEFNIERNYNFSRSKYEIEIENLIKDNITNEIRLNNRSIIKPFELDIYIPENKFAIEINGIYWHSYNKKESNKEKNKHLTKTLMCQEKDIHLFQIFEDELMNESKKDIWKSMILNKLGKSKKIFARKCNIKECSAKQAQDFFDKNHLQGNKQASIKIGLLYKDEIVCLMSFGKSRFNKSYKWELIRFANKKYCSVIGGASKLFKYFIKNYNPKNIISYADMRHSNGKLYEKLGFVFEYISPPNYYYFVPNENILKSRIQFQKHKLKNILENFDLNLTESQNMFNNGYRRIWDCGNIVCSYNKNI